MADRSDLLAKLRKTGWKYVGAGLSAFLVETNLAVHSVALIHKDMLYVIGSDLAYPFVSLVSVVLVIEEETLKGKALVALATGVGYAVGAWVFLTYS